MCCWHGKLSDGTTTVLVATRFCIFLAWIVFTSIFLSNNKVILSVALKRQAEVFAVEVVLPGPVVVVLVVIAISHDVARCASGRSGTTILIG